jgi:uncharacterized protein (DUF362 family)
LLKIYKKGQFSIIKDNAIVDYPSTPPYNPPAFYPELTETIKPPSLDHSNNVYSLVRMALITLGLDEKNYGTKEWNPFYDFIKKEDKIIIKPNFVIDDDSVSLDVFKASVTHPSLIRPIIDYIYKATEGKCEILIADGPLEGTSFIKTSKKLGLFNMVHYIQKKYNMKIKVMDLRDYILETFASFKVDNILLLRLLRTRKISSEDKYVTIDLEEYSEFESIYDQLNNLVSTRSLIDKVPSFAQSKGHHRYTISKEILDADVIFNFPKLKTHKFAGVTLCLKNLLGFTINRHYFGHYRRENVSSNIRGYVLEKLSRIRLTNNLALNILLNRKSLVNMPKLASTGSGIGNDTIWRAILDIARIILYVNSKGVLDDKKQRKHFAVVDGVIAGEGEGPLIPSPRKFGTVITGYDPLLIDIISSKLMGFDPLKIKKLYKAMKAHKYPISDVSEYESVLSYNIPSFCFKPATGWERARLIKNIDPNEIFTN